MARALRKPSYALRAIMASGLLLICVAWVAAHLTPVWLRSVLLPSLNEVFDGTATVTAIGVDPWRWKLTLNGLSLRQSDGRESLSVPELSAEFDVLGSLEEASLVLELRIRAPVLRLLRDSEGGFSPFPSTSGTLPGLPFLLRTVSVEGGRIEFRDESGGSPLDLAVDLVQLELADFGNDPDRVGRLQVVAVGVDLDRLALRGELGSAPLRCQGRLEIAGLRPPPEWSRWLPVSGLRLQEGRWDLNFDYRLAAEKTKTAVDIRDGRIEARGLVFSTDEHPGPFGIRTLNLLGLGYRGVPAELELESLQAFDLTSPAGQLAKLEVHQFHLKPAARSGRAAVSVLEQGQFGTSSFRRIETSEIDCDVDRDRCEALRVRVEGGMTPWFVFATAESQGLALTLGRLELRAERLEARDLAAADGRVAVLRLEGITQGLPSETLSIDAVAASGLATPWLSIETAAAGGVQASLTERSGRLDWAKLGGLKTLGPVEADRRPPPPVVTDPNPPRALPPARIGAGQLAPSRYVPRAAQLAELRLDELAVSLSRRRLAIGDLALRAAELDLRLKPGNILQIEGLSQWRLKARGAPAEEGDPDRRFRRVRPRLTTGAPAWLVQVDGLRVDDSSLVFRDESVMPAVRLGFGPVTLRLADFSSAPGRQFRFRLDAGIGERGKLEIDGQAGLSPLQAELRFGVDQLWLRSLQPYWQARTGVELVRGRLNLWGVLGLRHQRVLAIDYAGGADLVDVESVDRRQRRPFAGWSSLKFDGVVLSTEPRRFAVRSVSSEEPRARVEIDADGRLNLLRDLLDYPPVTASAGGFDWPVVIGLLKVKDLEMDFTDLRLQPGFAGKIQKLSGTISGLSSKPDATARVSLEGRFDRSAPVRIFGQINPFQFRNHTDVTLDFQGLNLTTLSPYSSRFAGYRIDKGKLDMTLRYRLRNGRLEADNRLILDQLVLGERVDQPGASRLPLDLAVAILKDADGRIDFELPISGNLSDPSFSLGSLYGEAIKQFFVKLATAPFTLIANLAKASAEDLGFVRFRPGATELSEDDRDRLVRVAGWVRQRPGVQLEIRGSADPEQDRLALADQALRARLHDQRRAELRASGQRPRNAALPDFSAVDYWRLFDRFYRSRHPEAATGLTAAEWDQARRRVLEEWPVSELELRSLAQRRGERVRDVLVGEGGVPGQRVYLLDVRLETPPDREIKTLLSLSPY